MQDTIRKDRSNAAGPHPEAVQEETASPGRRARDPRLDFFRGIAMFIIFVAHVPGNPWTLWIPARFGFSDATEIFVFCSGMASAFAFGSVFRARGFVVGTARTYYRAWQIYWVHIAIFFALAAGLAALDSWGAFGDNHVARLNLERFYADPKSNIVGLLTLTYVPNYFDILPMYFAILILLPIMVASRNLVWWAPFALSAAIWLLAQMNLLALPAEPWSDRKWFFNPFGWQLIFFTGFAFVSGWLREPPRSQRLLLAAVVLLVVTVPFAYFRLLREFEVLAAAARLIDPLTAKTEFGLLRYVHFLALAYVAWFAAGEGGRNLRPEGPFGLPVRVIHKVGQQALATFATGMILARFAPVLFIGWGKTALTVTLANLIGFAALIAVAYFMGWLKSDVLRTPKRVAARREV